MSTNLDRLRAFAADRSSLSRLAGVTTPVFMMQGRRDFAFGLDQATKAFRLLKGPKRLWIGLHGHAPSSFPAPDTAAMLTEGRLWFDRFLKGEPNGIDKRPPVVLAPEQWAGKGVSYPDLPPTRKLTYAVRGTTAIGAQGTVVRVLGTTTAAFEELGAATVRVTVTASGGWSRLVAVLSAVPPGRKEIVVSAGGVPTVPGKQTLTIRMIDDATSIPKGSALRLTLASSTARTAAGLLYLDLPMPAGSRLAVGPATVSVPVLAAPAVG